MTGSEDFSYMVHASKDKMGAMFFLGSGSDEKVFVTTCTPTLTTWTTTAYW